MRMNTNTVFYLALLGIGLCLFPAATISSAEETAAETVQSPAQTVSGEIVSVDPEGGFVVVQYPSESDASGTESGVFYLSETSTIVQNDANVEVSALKAGDSVTVEYAANESNNNVVSTLTVN